MPRLEPASATYRLPKVSAVIPSGEINDALSPMPSNLALLLAPPAKWVTTPSGLIFLIKHWLLSSAIYIFPFGSNVIPNGVSNPAFAAADAGGDGVPLSKA